MAAPLLNRFLIAISAHLLWIPWGFGEEGPVHPGRDVYLSYGCAACHGKNGDGQGMVMSHEGTAPTDLRDPNAYRYGHDQGSLRITITNGIKGEGVSMPAFKDMDQEDLDHLIDYVISLQKETKT